MTTTEPLPAVASGEPLETIAPLLGGPRIDDLLRRAAERAPNRAALRSAHRDLTFAELDAEANRCASALRELVGGPDVVIALAAVLDPVFAIGYFGISRSGNVSAVVNPLLTPNRLAHVLSTSAARVAIVSPELYRKLEPIRHQLPDLGTIVLTEPAPGLDLPVLADLLAAAPRFTEGPAPQDAAEKVACLQFTSGTTGAAKAAQLTHRNLTVNAAQTVYGQRLDETSVLFNYLPTFHLMHLTIGVCALATHVLWDCEDVAESVEVANQYRATHYYSLPMRLSNLARHPRLTELEAPRLQAIMSGGSTLPAATSIPLAQHFGVPAVQGYGMAECSPSTHLGNPEWHRTGSSGRLVPGAESRIVTLDTREVVPFGARGEIQVRGPQLMRGYLGRSEGQDFDADGWFSTGDIGYIDEDGFLFIVDRLKDTFKCDNWLVSPSEIERILLRHPAVSDCVVFDHPDDIRGAVAHAVVVPVGDADPGGLAEFVNKQVPYYEQIQHITLLDEIPRSATGKVQRRDIRERSTPTPIRRAN